MLGLSPFSEDDVDRTSQQGLQVQEQAAMSRALRPGSNCPTVTGQP
jgi:hypothetical protein